MSQNNRNNQNSNNNNKNNNSYSQNESYSYQKKQTYNRSNSSFPNILSNTDVDLRASNINNSFSNNINRSLSFTPNTPIKQEYNEHASYSSSYTNDQIDRAFVPEEQDEKIDKFKSYTEMCKKMSDELIKDIKDNADLTRKLKEAEMKCVNI